MLIPLGYHWKRSSWEDIVLGKTPEFIAGPTPRNVSSSTGDFPYLYISQGGIFPDEKGKMGNGRTGIFQKCSSKVNEPFPAGRKDTPHPMSPGDLHHNE